MARVPEWLRLEAVKARREADYAAGRADGIEWAAQAHERSPQEERGQPYPATPLIARQPTQQPVLEILRGAEHPMTIREIIIQAHQQGDDLMWDTVRDVLDRALERGQVRRHKGRFTIVPPQLSQSIDAAESDEPRRGDAIGNHRPR